MSTVERFLMAALGLVGLYLVLDKGAGDTFKNIAGGLSGVFKTLQGRG